MSDEKKTVELDRLDIFRELLERMENKVDGFIAAQRRNEDKVDEIIKDVRSVSAEVRSVSAEVSTVRSDQHVHRQRITTVESRVDSVEKRLDAAEKKLVRLEDKDGEIARQTSSVDLEHEAALAGAKTHMSKLETAVQSQGETLNKLVASQSAQTSTLDRIATTVTNAASTFTKTITYASRGAFVGGFIAGLAYAIWKFLGH